MRCSVLPCHPHLRCLVVALEFERMFQDVVRSIRDGPRPVPTGTPSVDNALGSALSNALARFEVDDQQAVADIAVAHLESALEDCDPVHKAIIGYNLATTLDSRSLLYRGPKERFWTEEWAHDRQRARLLYRETGRSKSADPLVRCRAWANLAKNLYLAGRCGEAVDACVDALRIDREFPPANAFMAVYIARTKSFGHSPIYRGVAISSARIALGNLERLIEITGDDQQFHAELRQIASNDLPSNLPSVEADEPSWADWIRRECLGFGMDEVGFADTDGDAGLVASLPLQRGDAVASQMVGVLNDLKSDFLLARDLAWRGENATYADAAEYLKTGGGEVYGERVSLYRQALGSAMQLVDRTSLVWALAADLDLTNMHSARTVWLNGGKREGLRPEIVAMIECGPIGWMVAAAAEMRYDLVVDKGYLGHLTAARNAATHRTISATSSPAAQTLDGGREVIHIDLLRNLAMAALRLSRHAIRYAAIATRRPISFSK